MRHRFIASMSVLAVVIALVSLVTIPLAGQGPTAAWKAKTTAATKTWTPPRTPWGDPDVQGLWNFVTNTPLERPSALGERQVLTDEEVAQQEDQAAQTRIDRAPREGDPGTYNRFWTDQPRVTRQTSLIVDPPDGRIPWTAEAQKREATEAEARRGVGMHEPTPGGWIYDLGPLAISLRCIMGFNSGPPMSGSGYNANVQLFQTAGYVAILNEMNHNTRIVPLDGRAHLPQHIRQWAGDSRGHWEGNTLVVDTVNFYDATSLRGSGPNMHLVERFTRVDADTLQYEFTVEDPTTFSKPWKAQIPMKPTEGLMYEYACHEGNYGLYNVLAGARAKEKAAEEAAKKGSR